MKLSSSM